MDDATTWLLESDPAIRWQVLRDLTDAPAGEVDAERARVATTGWGAQLLAARDADGQWAGGACFPGDFRGDFSQGQPWTSTFPTLTLLREFGVKPAAVRDTIDLVAEHCRWEHDGQRFFDGEVEPCINGRTLAVGVYFGVTPEQGDVAGLAERLLGEQLDDGGWNCEAENGSVRSSFDSTLCVLDGLLEYETATGSTDRLTTARERAEQYLLERRLFRRLSTGEVVDDNYLRFAFPTWWHHDVLRALDWFRAAALLTGAAPDPRLHEAIELVRSKQQPDRTWLLDRTHPGATWFATDDGDGRPSRWNTLRALRVLRWADSAH